MRCGGHCAECSPAYFVERGAQVNEAHGPRARSRLDQTACHVDAVLRAELRPENELSMAVPTEEPPNPWAFTANLTPVITVGSENPSFALRYVRNVICRFFLTKVLYPDQFTTRQRSPPGSHTGRLPQLFFSSKACRM